MTTIIVNPMDETQRTAVSAAPRLDTLRGKIIGLLDISKGGGSVFLDRIEKRLTERYGVKRVVRESKPTFAKPAPPDVVDRIVRNQCQGVIEALAD